MSQHIIQAMEEAFAAIKSCNRTRDTKNAPRPRKESPVATFEITGHHLDRPVVTSISAVLKNHPIIESVTVRPANASDGRPAEISLHPHRPPRQNFLSYPQQFVTAIRKGWAPRIEVVLDEMQEILRRKGYAVRGRQGIDGFLNLRISRKKREVGRFNFVVDGKTAFLNFADLIGKKEARRLIPLIFGSPSSTTRLLEKR